MRLSRIFAIVVFLMGAESFAQTSRSVLTGFVYDPEGLVVRDCLVQAERSGSTLRYQATTTANGQFAFPELPAGNYVVAISHKGFAPYTSPEIPVAATRIERYDIALEAEKPAVAAGEEEEEEEEEGEYYIDVVRRSEDSQWTHAVGADALKNIPQLGLPADEGRIRNPLDAARLTPGSFLTGQRYFSVNGSPSNTQSIRLDGRDISNGSMLRRTAEVQPGIEAVEEFSLQTSNFAAEYGQAAGGILHVATRSGTSAFHGSLYNYWAHEALNAEHPYTGEKLQDRRYDYGAAVGGPLSVPGVWKGPDRTFMFLNFEQFRQQSYSEKSFTVPTLAFRQGDFRKAFTGRKLGTDSLGRAIMEGAIYDPATERVVNGLRVRNPFPSNIIPKSRFDPVSALIQSYIPRPTDTDNSHIVNNYEAQWESPRLESIGSFKLDRSSGQSSLSLYYGINAGDASQSIGDGGDGSARAATGGKDIDTRAHTFLMNYERALSSTRTLHVGFGYQRLRWEQAPANGTFDPLEHLGLTGSNLSYFPFISGLDSTMGGSKDLGADRTGVSKMEKPGGDASMTWVHGRHILKFGGELRFEKYPSVTEYPASGSLHFSAEQTTLPYTYGEYLQGGTVGFPYGSFLLGYVDSGDIGVVSEPRLEKHSWAFFAQDSWKINRKLTLEFGLRYDRQTYPGETDGRIASFSATALNPYAGNLPGAMVYEGSVEGGCNCDFAEVYSGALAPRMGLALQLGQKMVLRAGLGVVYGQTATDNGATLSSGSTNPFFGTAYGNAAFRLKDGFPAAAAWPDPDINQAVIGSGVSPLAIHPEAGHPPKQVQWSLGLQRELMGNLLVEIAYVGNRGSRWESSGLANLNVLTAARLEDEFDLDLDEEEDRRLLLSTINSSLASQRGFQAPYAAFPTTETVAQSLRPFPQYGDIFYRWAPIGKTWYDSVQVKVTRRFSGGFAIDSGYAWQKAYSAGDDIYTATNGLESVDEDFDMNAERHVSPLSQPHAVYVAPAYTSPRLSGGSILSKIFSEWQVSAMLQYASGLPIPVPVSNSNLYALLFQPTYANRAPGQSFFLKDPNDRGIDPLNDFVLNAAGWADPSEGQFSTSKAYFDDYRFKRRPSEQISAGKRIRLNDRLQLNVRIDFQNVFNNKEPENPYHVNANAFQLRDDDGEIVTGFGYVNYRNLAAKPRNGQVLVRMEF